MQPNSCQCMTVGQFLAVLLYSVSGSLRKIFMSYISGQHHGITLQHIVQFNCAQFLHVQHLNFLLSFPCVVSINVMIDELAQYHLAQVHRSPSSVHLVSRSLQLKTFLQHVIKISGQHVFLFFIYTPFCPQLCATNLSADVVAVWESNVISRMIFMRLLSVRSAEVYVAVVYRENIACLR